MKTIKVVAALFEKDDKILLAQRLKGKYENMWEFPGGKVEIDESDEEAIEREIKEELNIEVKSEKFIKNNVYEYPDIKIDLRLYKIKYISGEISLKEHKKIIWIDKNTILDYDLVPADIELAKYINDNDNE